MDQAIQADENELQKAINNITSGDNTASSVEATLGADLHGAGAAIAPEPEVALTANDAPQIDETPVMAEAAEAPVVGNIDAGAPQESLGDLARVKNSALLDLRPILDRVELPAENKFKIYKEIITSTKDKAAIEPAYNAAKQIADDRERAEALLFIVNTIDDLNDVV